MKTISKFLMAIFTILLIHNFTFSQWVQTTSGTTNFLTSITTITTTVNYAAGFAGTFLRSTNSGQTWITQTSPSASNINGICFLPTGFGTTGWAASVTGVHKTTNAGANWVQQIASGSFIDVLFTDLSTGFALSSNNLVSKTTNGGTNFTSSSYISNNQVSGKKIIQLSVQNFLILCADNANDTSFIIKTTNQGTSWSQLGRVNGTFLNAAFINATTGIMCGNNGAAIRTTNGGANWTVVSSGTSNLLIGLNIVSSSIIYMAGSNGTIKKSTNAGLNWFTQASPVTSNLRSIDAFPTDDFGLIAGAGGTILKTTNGGTVTSVIQSGNEVPESFSLSQNYPNPFNPETKISFYIPLSRGVSEGRGVFTFLKVFDILGNEIEELVNENLTPGSYFINFNASSLPSGTYFYRLQAGSFTDTKKLVLVK